MRDTKKDSGSSTKGQSKNNIKSLELARLQSEARSITSTARARRDEMRVLRKRADDAVSESRKLVP
jgi:hypothetical protein